jgi:hypothetical protein
MKKTNFRDWTIEKIEECFNLKQVFKHPLLQRLRDFEYELSAFEKYYLESLQENYVLYGGEDWNEAELESKFISPLIVSSKIDNHTFGYFLERDLAATIDDYELVGKVDGMVATGFRRPKKPYFCVHEYKKESDPSGDPRGQVLIAMLVAQEMNQDGKPIYGLYVVGKVWRFIVLEGKNYSFSKTYVADEEDIFLIFKVLKALRYEIEQMIKN